MLTQTASTATVLTLAGIVEQPTKETLKLISKSIAPRTLGNYKDTLKLYYAWLAGRAPSDTNLANYLTELFEQGRPPKDEDDKPEPQAPGSLALVVNAVRWCEREGEAQGELVGKLTLKTLAGLRREGKGRGDGPRRGLSRDQVSIMANAAQRTDTTAGARDAALLLVMSDALLRIGEAVAIDCEHITIEADGSGRLRIPSSKTDQEGAGAVQYLHPNTVAAVEQLKERAGYTAGPLFRRVLKGDHCHNERITHHTARRAIKRWAKDAAGLSKKEVSGHSLRIGTAQELAQRGATLTELQNAGRWTDSKMPAHYTKNEEAGKGAVARLLK